MLAYTDHELDHLIQAWERSAEHHIEFAKRASTEFQRLFHERRAGEALLRADRYRTELLQRREAQGSDQPAGRLPDRQPQG